MVKKKPSKTMSVQEALEQVRKEVHRVTEGMTKSDQVNLYEDVCSDLEGMIEAVNQEIEDEEIEDEEIEDEEIEDEEIEDEEIEEKEEEEGDEDDD